MITFAGGPVEASSELLRIKNLPTRRAEFPALPDLRRDASVALRPIQERMLQEALEVRGLFAAVGVGHGKCLGRGTPVLMFDGSIKAVEDVVTGDVLMGPDSRPRNVLSVCRGREMLYEVRPVKGDPYIVNESHILSLKQTCLNAGSAFPSERGGRIRNLSVLEYLSSSRKFKLNWKGWRTGVEFQAEPPVFEPYILGQWLGDGCTEHPGVTTADIEVVEELYSFASRLGVSIRKQDHKDNKASTYFFKTCTVFGVKDRNPVTSWLRSIEVMGNKHVPHRYKTASRHDRLELLAGILDSDGSLAYSGFDFISKLEVLADDVCFLARSLGLAAYKQKCEKTCTNNGVVGTYYRVGISGDCSVIPTRIARKKAPARKQKKSVLMTGITVRPIGEGDYFGFAIDGDRLFMLGDFTVTHNTIPSLLIPTLLGAKRPVLLLPAALVQKTENERRILGQIWQVCRSIELISYQELGRVGAAGRLEMRNPDVIVADECQKLKHRKAAVTRRVARHMHDHPETIFIALSGTILEKELDQFAHIMAWCLKDKAPIPLRAEVLREWAEALDPKVDPMRRREPGALITLSPGAETGAEAFRRRLERTEGIVISADADSFGGSLIVERLSFETDPVTEENFEKLRELAETPDGWALTEAIEVYNVAMQLALGMCYAWEPRPPDEWRAARRAWAKFVRETLARSHHLDSELQVLKAVQAGELADGGLLEAWLVTKPTFQINVVDQWYDDSALCAAEEWLGEQKEGSIVWCKHAFFARALAKRTGLDYFGAKGLNKDGARIDDPERKSYGKNCIASEQANGTGRNLQAWNRNLITAPGADPGLLEQLIGRTHRQGQKADEVYVDFFWNCREHDSAIEKSILGSREDALLSGQTKKILLADVVPPGPKGRGAAWRI